MNFRTKQLGATFTVSAIMLTGVLTAQNIQEGLKYLENEQFSKAKGVFESLAAQSPTAENYYYLGYFYLKSDNPNADLAAQNFNKGLAADPKSYLNKVGLAAVKLYQENKTVANSEFQAVATETKYKNADVLYRIAEAYILFKNKKESSDPDKCIEYSERLLELVKAKDKPEYYIVLGNAYYAKGNAGKSISNYTKASEIATDKAEAYVLIGNVWGRASNKQLAEENFKKALAANSNYAPAYKYIADYNTRNKKYQEAFVNLQKYVELSGNNDGEILMNLSNLSLYAQNYDQALNVLDKSWDSISDPMKYRLKASILSEKLDYAGALTNMSQYMGLIPESEKTGSDYGLLGKIQSELASSAAGEEKSKLTRDAVANLTQAQNKGDGTYDYQALLLNLNPAAGGTQVATITNPKIEALKKAVASNPKDTKSLYNLATEQYEAKDYLGSIASWDKLIALIPDWASAYAGKGMALYAYDVTDQSGLTAQAYQKYIEMVEPKGEYSEAEKSYLATAYSFFAYKEFQAQNMEKAQEYVNKTLAVEPQNSDALNLQKQMKL